MLLAIDIGNTNVVIGIYQEKKLITSWRLSSKADRTGDEYWILLNSLFNSNKINICQFDGAIISSVVPDLTMPFIQIVEKYCTLKPVTVDSDLNIKLKLDVDNPRSVGADRICNVVAGFEKYGGPLVILDFGTATTFDVITENYEFIGGIIAPGIEMTATVLHQLAAKLPKVELKFPETVIGRNTETNIQSGLMFGTADLINGLFARIENELGQKFTSIATGGLANVVTPYLDRKVFIESDLTLEGMRLIYEELKLYTR